MGTNIHPASLTSKESGEESHDSKESSEKETYNALTWFGLLLAVVALVFFVWVVIIFAIQGPTGTWISLQFATSFMFGGSIVFWLIPVTAEEADYGPKRRLWCKRSWKWWYEIMTLICLILFVTFINVSIYMVTIVGTSPTNTSSIAMPAFVAAVIVTVMALALQAIHDVAYVFTFWVFLMILVLESIPLPRGGELTAIASLSLAVLLAVTLVLKKVISLLIRDIHMHILVGISVIFSAYFSFDSYAKWINQSFLDFKWTYLWILLIAMGRWIWKWLIERLENVDHIVDVMIWKKKERLKKKKVLEKPLQQEEEEENPLIQEGVVDDLELEYL